MRCLRRTSLTERATLYFFLSFFITLCGQILRDGLVSFLRRAKITKDDGEFGIRHELFLDWGDL